MPVTAREMTRRRLLRGCAVTVCAVVCQRVALLRADEAQDVWNVLTEAASALSEANAKSFLALFDRSMPDYGMLEANVNALLNQDQVQSSIELLSEEGDSTIRMVELDWFLQVVEQQDTAGLARRRERVRCRLAKRGRKWIITSIEPVAFFAPLRPTR
jgi:hypothetical protein